MNRENIILYQKENGRIPIEEFLLKIPPREIETARRYRDDYIGRHEHEHEHE